MTLTSVGTQGRNAAAIAMTTAAITAAALTGLPAAAAAAQSATQAGAQTTAQAGGGNTGGAALIPRRDLFGNPSRTSAQVSPDGKMLAFLAPRDGVMNVWVAPMGQMEEAKPITEEKVRPIRSYFWAPDSNQVLYIQDKGGTEDFLLYGVDLTEGKTRSYTPFEKTRVQVVGVSPAKPDEILVGLNNRDPRWHDVHRLNLKTGELTLVRQNDGYAGFEADHDLVLRLAMKPQPDGGMAVETIAADGGTKPLTVIGPDDALTTNI
ncbi:MAG: hypothetical protein RLY86_3532, partial [Pseudomonadota bacterium]